MQKDQMEQQSSSSSDQSLTSPINMLPNELQHKILFHLLTDDATRCKAVCKDWENAIKSLASGTPAVAYTPRQQEPFYLMFNYPDSTATYTYNTGKTKWVSFQNLDYNQLVHFASSADEFLPKEFYLKFSASGGLVCYADQLSPDNIICVCNPILNDRLRILPYWSRAHVSDSFTLSCGFALSTDIHSRNYVVAMIRSCEDKLFSISRKMMIMLYDSKIQSWVNLHTEEDTSWLLVHGSCVICQDKLYSVILIDRLFVESTQPRHGVVAYDLSRWNKQKRSLTDTMVHVPCAMLCVELLNLNEKLILVGGIVNVPNETDDKSTIGIWEMRDENAWKEITRAPSDVIRRFQDDAPVGSCSFMSSGYENLIFFQGYKSSDLLMYDLRNDVWKFMPKPPFASSINGRRGNYFGGFCFEPRLDIVP